MPLDKEDLAFNAMFVSREKHAELEQKLEEAQGLIEHLTLLVDSIAPGFVQKAIAEYFDLIRR